MAVFKFILEQARPTALRQTAINTRSCNENTSGAYRIVDQMGYSEGGGILGNIVGYNKHCYCKISTNN
jgi:hypothetical protein